MAVPLTVADVFCIPLLLVNCRFWGALAVIVMVPGAEQVASPVEPISAAAEPALVGEVFQDSPSTCDSSRLLPLAKFPVAVYPTSPWLLDAVADCGLTVILFKLA